MVHSKLGRHLLGCLLVLSIVQVIGLTGCNTGRRNERNAATGGVGPNCLDQAVPFFQSVSNDEACAGTTITINGLNYSLDPVNNFVNFESADGTTSIRAEVLQAIDNGPSADFAGCQSTSLLVAVPAGARSGLVQITVRTDEGTVLPGGAFTFTACPEIIGYGVGQDADGFMVNGATGFLNDQLQIFGYNLDAVTGVVVTDPNGTVFDAFAVVAAGLATPNYTVPNGMSVVTVTMENGLVPDCETFFFDLQLVSNLGAGTLSSNRVIIPARTAFGPTDFEDLPGVITGAIVPPGVRSGVIPITYSLAAAPAQNRYDVIPEYFDPNTMDWVPCTGVTANEGIRRLAGFTGMTTAGLGLISGGATYTFNWDSGADIRGQTQTVAVRIPVEPNGGAIGICPTFSDDTRRYELPNLVISNPSDAGDVLLPIEGSIVEEFNDTSSLDTATMATADWNAVSSGVLSGPAAGGLPAWGTGTFAVSLDAGGVYIFNTNTGGLFDFTDDTNPIPLAVGQPGAALGEFHFQSLVINDGADVSVEGDNPLVVRLSGNGDLNSTIGVFRSTINLDGEDGTEGDDNPFAQGIGGVGFAGGGVGGDGGLVDILAGAGGVVQGDTPAIRGGNNGGYGGQNVTFGRVGEPSSGRAGAGGGGGAETRGEDGTGNAGPTNDQADHGLGGPARGDTTLLETVAGAGGGGGGTTSFRQLTTSDLAPRNGGGAGAGGGGFLVIANGTIDLSGTITANGGDGRKGATSLAGPGGGGSGGTIRFSAAGDILVRDSARLEANGGSGANSSTSMILVSGDGSDGIIRLDAGPGRRVNFPSIGDFSQLMPGIVTTGVSQGTSAAGSIDGGTGLDGAADLTGAPGSIYTVDTDLGLIMDPSGATVVTRGVDPVAFHLSGLTLANGVTLLAMGSQPLVLRVLGSAQIVGTIDVSGQAGGTPDVDVDPPVGGLGGPGGPGSSVGGDGGAVISAADFTDGQDGALTHLAPFGLLDPAPPFSGGGSPGDPFPPPVVGAAGGGESVADVAGPADAGPGGGGGYATSGDDGLGSADSAAAGLGGSAYGSNVFTLAPISSERLPVGGGPGAGGGGHIESMSTAFDSAPGTGGGGGGGYCQISVVGILNFEVDAEIIATGGDALRAPFKGGNAGAGAGGGVFVQCDGVAEFRGTVDVRGGDANGAPTGVSYAPNSDLEAGGDGANGRIRVETPTGFVADGALEISPLPSIGTFEEAAAILTTAVSTPYILTVNGGAQSAGPVTFDPPIITSMEPAGSSVKVLYSGAKYSLDVPGTIGDFAGFVDDPNKLEDPDFVILHFYLFNGGMNPEIDMIELPYFYPQAAP